MTSTLFPDFVAQASAAFLTAVVSASPELPIMIVSLTGPLPVLCGALLLLPLNPPPPQALRTSAPVAASASAAAPRVLGALMSLLFPCHAVARRFRAGSDDELGGEEETTRGIAGVGTGCEHVEHAVGNAVEGLVEAAEVERVRDVRVVEAHDADVDARRQPALDEDAPDTQGQRVGGTHDRGTRSEDVDKPGRGAGRGLQRLRARRLPLGVRHAELRGGPHPTGAALVAAEIGRAHVGTPVTPITSMPSSA